MKATLSMLATGALAAGLLLTLAACTDTADQVADDNPAVAAPVPEGMPPGHPTTTAAPVADLTVAAIEEGKDIAWVHANKDALAGESVSLRGKVVKFNANILDTNWLHIQDGSGSAADASNDLTVTSAAQAAVGDTVIVTGNVVLDKDFGAGYSYPVLLEDASLTVE